MNLDLRDSKVLLNYLAQEKPPLLSGQFLIVEGMTI
jgi:hypothetical protein